MLLWLIKNYFSLKPFLNIKINPLAIYYSGLLWQIDYKISHNQLNFEQKLLSDEFCKRLKGVDRYFCNFLFKRS